MLKKFKNSQKGPSWFEVGLGAVLSVILGVGCGMVYMIAKPVTKVPSIPKDAPSGAVYYIEGAKDLNRTGIAEKRKQFTNGESIVVDEGELNAFFASLAPRAAAPPPAPKPKPGEKPAPPPPAPDAKVFDTSPLNARIRESVIQFGDTVTINVFGASFSVIVQATGTFSKHGPEFEFDPDTLTVGGCPMQKLLLIRGYVMKKLLFATPAPDDVASAWSRLADVSLDGTKLRLKMP
jgi:hypothetical protein